MIYLIIALYLLFICYLYDLRNLKIGRGFHYFFSMVVLICVAGFRYRMAPDSVTYMGDFMYNTHDLFNLSWNDFTVTRYQPFWILLNSICKTISDDFVVMQFATAIILHASIFYFFKNITTKYFTCILFYFLIDYVYFSMEIMRESLAISMFLISIVHFTRKKIGKSLLFTLFAILFHSFAVFLFVIYFFMNHKISQKFKIGLTIVITVFFAFASKPLAFITQFLSPSIQSQLSAYEMVELNKMTLLGYVYIVFRILPELFVLYYYRKKEIPFLKVDKKILMNFAIIYISIVVIRAAAIPFIERFSNYFILPVVALVTPVVFDFLYRKVFRNFQFFALSSISIIVAVFYIWPLLKIDTFLTVPFYKRYYPYDSIFTKEKDVDREFIIRREAKEY